MMTAVIMTFAFFGCLLNGWDSIGKIGLKKLLTARKLEFIAGMLMLDMGKGVFCYYLLDHSQQWLLLLTAFLILAGSLLKYLFTGNAASFLMLLGFIWPIFPRVVNTMVVLAGIAICFHFFGAGAYDIAE